MLTSHDRGTVDVAATSDPAPVAAKRASASAAGTASAGAKAGGRVAARSARADAYVAFSARRPSDGLDALLGRAVAQRSVPAARRPPATPARTLQRMAFDVWEVAAEAELRKILGAKMSSVGPIATAALSRDERKALLALLETDDLFNALGPPRLVALRAEVAADDKLRQAAKGRAVAPPPPTIASAAPPPAPTARATPLAPPPASGAAGAGAQTPVAKPATSQHAAPPKIVPPASAPPPAPKIVPPASAPPPVPAAAPAPAPGPPRPVVGSPRPAPAVVAANPALLAADVAPASVLLAGTLMTSPDRKTVYEASMHDRVITVRTPRVTVAGRFRKAKSAYWLTDGRGVAEDPAEAEDTEIAACSPLTGTFLPAGKLFTDTEGKQPDSLKKDALVLPVSADPRSGKTTFTLPGEDGMWSVLTSALSPVPMLACWLPLRGERCWVKLGDTAARSLTVDEILMNPEDVEARHAPSDRIVEAGSAGFTALPPGELFPAGSPKAADVRQSGLGTCHLQAVLIELAERDPAYLRTEVIKPAGANYSVRFFAKHSAGTAFVPERVLVDATLPTDAAGEPLYSAGANWARLIEKAFAVFAAKHGLEGMAYAKPPEAIAGYAGIAGGQSHPLYRVFYGADAAVSETPMGFNRSAPGFGVTLAAVNELVKFAHPEAGQKRFLTAAGDVASHVDRAIAEAAATGLPDAHGVQLETFKTKLAAAKRDLASTDKVGSERNSIASVREMRAAAAAMAKTLEGYAPLPLRELCLDLQASGDSSTGSRFIYGGHAYAVIAATVAMTDGTRPTRPLASTDLANVDFAASRVTLRNPHRMHVPQGVTGSETGADAGRFELTLEQFMRNFDKLQGGVVTRTAAAR